MVRILTFLAIFLTVFGVFVGRAYRAGDIDEPPRGGDAVDYESIAFNLWSGRGFGYDWSDPQWRQPYRRSPRFEAEALGDRQSGYYPTTYRPPAFPALWALVYSATGRNFAAVRIMNCALMAGAVTLGAAVAAHFAGLVAAPAAVVLLLQSPDLTKYSQRLLTESLAACLVSLLAWLWVSRSDIEVSARAAAVSGVVLGLLVLTRSIFVLWLPIALLMPGRPAAGRTGLWRARAICVLACVLVVAPWWARNIMITDAFLPMGSQGHINLPAGFSQRALDNQGRWRSNVETPPELIAAGVDPYSIEFEVRLAHHRSAAAVTWMREHPWDVVRLLGMHVWQELRPQRGTTTPWGLLFPAAVVALIYFRRRPGILAVTLILGATVLSIALTWGFTGRFMVPVQPLMLALVSAMLMSIAGRLALGLHRLVQAGTRHA